MCIWERVVEIVGIEGAEGVHTIDVWFSERRQRWVVERRDADGAVVGWSFCAANEHDATDCLAEWLRAHAEVHLVGRDARRAAEAMERVDRAA